MKGRIILGIISIVSLLSCKHKGKLNEIKDKDISFQVIQLKDKAEDGTGLSYKARLLPDRKLIEALTKENKEALYYRMDSCFYIQNGNNKIYAAMVQPIANGISGSYEYLLDFELDRRQKEDTINLVYRDKYINHQEYQLKIVKE
jgi:hypothetical protein